MTVKEKVIMMLEKTNIEMELAKVQFEETKAFIENADTEDAVYYTAKISEIAKKYGNLKEQQKMLLWIIEDEKEIKNVRV